LLRRDWRLLKAYLVSLFLTIAILAGPRLKPAGVPASTGAGERSTVLKRGAARFLFDSAGRGLFRYALRTTLPWAEAIEDPGEEGPNGSAWLRRTVLSLFGFSGDDAAGILGGGIAAIAQVRVDVYYAGRSAGTDASGDHGDVSAAAITSMPPRRATVGGGKPLVGIYHTHARESFLPELPEANVMRPDDAHTNNLDLSVVRLGRELAAALSSDHGIVAVHSPEMHDAEGKLGAYIKSEATVGKILRDYPTVKVLLDVHRDSQPRERTTVEIRGQRYARVMIVLGTDNPNWHKNRAFAQEVIKVMDRDFPGMSVGIYPKPGKFNQGYCPGSLILEIGGVENTLEECLRTSRAMAAILSEVLRTYGVPV